MTLFLRIFQVFFRSLFRPRLNDMGEMSSDSFRVQLWDLDFFVHLNNARYLNYMEAGRWGLLVRTGLLRTCLRNRWTFPIAKIEIRYYRPIQFWQKFEVTAQMVAMGPRGLFVHQRFMREGRVMSEALLRAVIVSKTGTVAPDVYLKEFAVSSEQVKVPPEIESWFARFAEPTGRPSLKPQLPKRSAAQG